MGRWKFDRHMPVFLRSGQRLGRVEEIAHGLDFLHVQHGHALVQDWYVPVDDVEDVGSEGVRLHVDLVTLRQKRRHVPPERFLAQQGASPGYEYKSPDRGPAVPRARDQN